MPTKYLTRPLATQYIRDQGVPLNSNRLADLAYEGCGPKFARINGRALYRAEWLDAWIKAEAARSVKRRRRSAQQPDAAA